MATRDSTGDKLTAKCRNVRFPVPTSSSLAITNQGCIIQVSNLFMAVEFQ